MLPQDLIDSFHKHLNVQLYESKKRFSKELEAIDRSLAAKKMFHSGNRIRNIIDAYEKEIQTRSEIMWESFKSSHNAIGSPISNDLYTRIKIEIDNFINLLDRELSPELLRTLSRQNLASTEIFSIKDALLQSNKKLDSEADLYVKKLITSSAQKSKYAAPQIHFHGPIGAVQTADNSTANITQILGSEGADSLLSTLTSLKNILENETSINQKQRSDLIEIADDCLKETISESPNTPKLTALLNILGTTIQSIASARPAYDAIMLALSSLSG